MTADITSMWAEEEHPTFEQVEPADWLTHRAVIRDERIVSAAPLPLYDLNAYRAARARHLSEDEAREFAKTGRYTHRLFEGYQPHEGQRRLHRCRHARFVAVCAGRRGGKTKACAVEFLARVFRDYAVFLRNGGKWTEPEKYAGDIYGALQYWLVAPTYRHTLLMLQAIFELIGGTDSHLVAHYNRSAGRLWLIGGIKIEARSADNPSMLVGDSLNGVWMDEAARVKALTWSDNIKSNLDDRGGWGLFSTTPLGMNWFYQQIWQCTNLGTDLEKRDERFAAVTWTTADNTALPLLAAEMALARKVLPYAIFARNYLASFTAFDGQVFPMFNADATHIVQSVPYGNLIRRWGGIDWGAGNPGVQLEIGLDATGTLWVMREDYKAELTVSPPTHNPRADSWVNRCKRARNLRSVGHWWADPSGKGNIMTMRKEGLDVRPAMNDVVAGIDVVAALLNPVVPPSGGKKRPGLLIHKSCKNLIRELVSYRWNDDGTKPRKEDDHAPDALRYGVFTEHMRGAPLHNEVLKWNMFSRTGGRRKGA